MKDLNQQIEKIVRQKIESDENLGSQAGGSGHLGHVSYEINKLNFEEVNDEYVVEYDYTLYTETEFTYYPDNPPYESSYRKRLTLGLELNILAETNAESLGGTFEMPNEDLL